MNYRRGVQRVSSGQNIPNAPYPLSRPAPGPHPLALVTTDLFPWLQYNCGIMYFKPWEYLRQPRLSICYTQVHTSFCHVSTPNKETIYMYMYCGCFYLVNCVRGLPPFSWTVAMAVSLNNLFDFQDEVEGPKGHTIRIQFPGVESFQEKIPLIRMKRVFFFVNKKNPMWRWQKKEEEEKKNL